MCNHDQRLGPFIVTCFRRFGKGPVCGAQNEAALGLAPKIHASSCFSSRPPKRRRLMPSQGYAENRKHYDENAGTERMRIELHYKISAGADDLREVHVFKEFHRLRPGVSVNV